MAGMRYQPQGAYRLSSAWLGRIFGGWLAGSAGYIPLGSKAITTTAQFSTISKILGTPAGLALSANAASDAGAAAFLTINHGVTRNNFTFAGVFRVRATGGVGVGARSDTDNIFLWRNGGNYAVRLNNVTVSGPAMPLNTTLNYVLTSTTEGVFLCVNGALILSMAASVATAIGVGIDVFEDPRGGGAMDMDAPLCFVSTGIPAGEAQALSSNLWQIFSATVDDEEIAAAAPINSYRLTADRGSFSLTGVAADLRASRVMSASSGAFGLSGAPVALTATRRLAVAPGAFALAVADVGLMAARRLAAGAGAFSLTGSAASILASRRLPIGSVAFGLLGSSAALRASRRLTALPGVFALSPSSVQMTYRPADGQTGGLVTYTLTAAPGSFDVVGSSAGLRAQRQLRASAGALSLSGSAVRLAVGRRLPAATGALSLDGIPVGLMATRRIPAQAGAFCLIGADVKLRYSAQIEYARAPAGSGYTPQRHEYSSRPAATSSPRPAATQRNYR